MGLSFSLSPPKDGLSVCVRVCMGHCVFAKCSSECPEGRIFPRVWGSPLSIRELLEMPHRIQSSMQGHCIKIHASTPLLSGPIQVRSAVHPPVNLRVLDIPRDQNALGYCPLTTTASPPTIAFMQILYLRHISYLDASLGP